MDMPTVDNVVVEQERNITYNVKAFRKLTEEELLITLRAFVGAQKRKLKKNSHYTIMTIIGYND